MRLLNSLKKNWLVVQTQWALYMTEIRTVIKPGIKAAPWYRKPHKVAAYVEEFYDKCPRIAFYLDTVRVPLEVVGVITVIGWLL